MKKVFKIIPIALLLTSLFSAAIFVNNEKKDTPTPVEAAASGYKVKINITVTNDADEWEEAYYRIFVRSDHGRGGDRALDWSENFYNSISYSGASYTSSETYTGTDFPSYVQVYTGLGAFWQYHYGESDVKVYINGINVTTQHITYGGWNYDTYSSFIVIDQSKFPRPDPKKIQLNYSENVDPDDESTQIVKISATDQYGVNWTQPASDPISLVNESYPENDMADRLDNGGLKWKLRSTLENNHYSTYTVKIPTASSVYPIVEKKFTVQFAFPLHLLIMVDNKLAMKISAFKGDVIVLPTEKLTTPTGYYIASYKKTSGMGSIEQDKENKEIFRFTFISGDTTVTATLKPITYVVRFDKNAEDASGTLVDKKVTYNAKNTYLPMNRYTRNGYKFLGWNTKADGTGTSFANQAAIYNLSSTKDEVVMLYAQWESLNPSVTASLFTDGYFGLIVGGIVAVGAVVAISIFLVNRSKKRKV